MLMHDCGLYGNNTIPGLLEMFLIVMCTSELQGALGLPWRGLVMKTTIQ